MTGAGGASTSVLDRWLRPGANSPRDVTVDLLWLVGLASLLMATGLGLRDPWPADEPRFALVAQDMLRSRRLDDSASSAATSTPTNPRCSSG